MASIILKRSSVAGKVPLTTDLQYGEITLNYADGLIYYKKSDNTIGTISGGSSGGGSGSSVNFGGYTRTSFTATANQTTFTVNYQVGYVEVYLNGVLLRSNDYTASNGTTIVLAVGANVNELVDVISFVTSLGSGTVPIANGGTGQTTASTGFNALSPITTTGDLIIGNGTNSATRLGIGTTGQILTSSGTAPQWSTLSGVAVTTLSFGTTGLTPSTATSGAITVAGTLAITNGGTGQTSFTSGQIHYGSFSTSTNLFWDSANNRLGVGTSSPAVSMSISATDAILIPNGTTGQRPTGAAGYLRFNSTTVQFEGYNGTAWSSVGGANITDDTTTNSTEYPLYASITSGAATTVYVSSTKLTYNPSTGQYASPEFYASNGVLTHANQVSTSYTVPTNANVITVGPWTVASGVTFTLPSGSRQVLL